MEAVSETFCDSLAVWYEFWFTLEEGVRIDLEFTRKNYRMLPGKNVSRSSDLRSPVLFYCDRYRSQLDFWCHYRHVRWLEKRKTTEGDWFEEYLFRLWWVKFISLGVLVFWIKNFLVFKNELSAEFEKYSLAETLAFSIIICKCRKISTVKSKNEPYTCKFFTCKHVFAGLNRSAFDNKTVSFEEHIEKEHNMWHYLYFIVLVKVKDPTEFTGPESYVYAMVHVRMSIFY